jgi:hypothetical protein
MALPAATPVTRPVVDPTVTIAELLLVQVPVPAEHVKVEAIPLHMFEAPFIEGIMTTTLSCGPQHPETDIDLK